MRGLWMVVGLVSCGDNGTKLDPDASVPDASVADGSNTPDGPSGIRVSVAKTGTGNGTFTVNGTACAAPCEAFVPAFSVVTVEGIPDDSSLSGQWVGCDTVSTNGAGSTCGFQILAQPIEVTAQFDWPLFNFRVDSSDGTGTVSVSGEQLCLSNCRVPAGAQLTFTATGSAATHSAVQRWSLESCGSDASCTFTVPRAPFPPIERVFFGRDNSLANGATTFTATKEGNPLWEPTGFKIVSVFGNELQALRRLWVGHDFNAGVNAFFPMAAHTGPYEDEVATRLASLGWDDGNRFPVIDWATSSTRSLAFLGAIVPAANAPQGSTKDYASGPIVPRDLALFVDGDMFKDDVLIDSDFDQPYGTLAAASPASTEDGWSHMTLSFGENQSFIPGTPGNYRFHLHVFEINTPGNGWHVDVPFVIDP